MSLETIVSVTVSRDTRAPTQRGFNSVILVGYHTAWMDRVREYADPSEMLDDGFTVSHHMYKMATVLKSQSPSLSTFKIGRRANSYTQIVHVFPRLAVSGLSHELVYDGVTYTATGTTVALVVASFVTAMSGAVGATATNGTTHLVVTSTTAGKVHEFSVSRRLELFDASTFTPDDLTEDLEAIYEEDSDFYGVALDNQSQAEIEELSDWVEAKTLLAIVDSADWDIMDGGQTGDVASAMLATAYVRTSGLARTSIGTFGGTALIGNLLPRNPGSYTAAFKTLGGISADVLTTTKQSAILAKRWSHYVSTNGVNIVYEGKTPAGEFIDIPHSIDFSTVRIREAVFGVLTGNAKVPYTDTGAETIRAAVLGVLMQCSTSEYPIFDRDSVTCTVPKVADVSSANRANRILPNVVYQARLQGAIHTVVVRGEVYV